MPADDLQLYYWNGRGLLEVGRMVLAAAGKKAGVDYADIRVTTDIDPETGQQLKNGEPVVDADGAPVMYDKAGKDVRAMSTIGVKGEPGPLDINLGRVPLVITPDGAIGQRAAINAYLADVCGLNGANPLERATIVAIDEALREMKAAWDNMPSGGETDEEKAASAAEKLATWFAESAAKDYCGPSDMSGTRGERRAMWFMKRLETFLGDDGYAVGGKLSLGDLLIYNAFAETLTDAELPRPEFPASRRYPFGDLEATNAALAGYPKISAIIASVKADANIAAYLAARGKQMF